MAIAVQVDKNYDEESRGAMGASMRGMRWSWGYIGQETLFSRP